MQQLNLLEARLQPPELLLSGTRLVALCLVAALAVGTHGVLEQRRMTQTLASGEPEGLSTDTAEAPPEQADSRLRARIAQRRALRDALAGADQLPADSAALLQSVMAALPDNLWLTDVEVLGRAGVRLSGGALDPVALGSFAQRLASIPALKGVPIEALRLEPQAANGDGSSPAATATVHQFVLASASFADMDGSR